MNVSEAKVQLINFDKKTYYYLFICTILFVLGVLLKINLSNSGAWHYVFNDIYNFKKSSLINSATPQLIRSDEWMVGTPNQLSQYYSGMNIDNISIGTKGTPLMISVPAKHIYSLFNISCYGFMFLDVERAVSFYWLSKPYLFFVGFFLMLMLLTKNNHFISIFGTAIVYCSSGIQWWSVFCDYITSISFIFVGVIYILYNPKNTKNVILAFLAILFFGLFFIPVLYPPRQVPMSYMLIVLLISFIMINDKKLLLQNYKLKILYFTLILLAASFFLYTWYVDISQTINVVMNTEYPGKRDVTQKPYSFYQLFTEPFFNFISPEKCPPQLMNICEASNFYLFFPYLFVFLYYVVKNKDYKKQYDILFLTLFCVVLTLIAAIGIHPFIAKVTLFNLVTLDRISYTLGTASMIAIFIYLSKNAPIKCNNVLIVLIIIVFSVILSLYVNSSLNNYFTSNQTIMAALILIIGFLCLHFKGKKYVTEAFLILLLLLNIKNLYSNPPTAGLNSIIKNPVFKEIRQYVSQNPKHTWLVYGQATYANFIKTTGAIVINGTKFSPNNDLMKSINNSDDAKSVYNRYGHISVNLLGSTIDTAIFQKNSDDAFSIYVDPCSNKIKNLKIDRYIFFTQPPNDAILCLELDTSFKSLLVYYSK